MHIISIIKFNGYNMNKGVIRHISECSTKVVVNSQINIKVTKGSIEIPKKPVNQK